MRAVYDISLLHCYCNCSLSSVGSPPATHDWKEKSVSVQWQWRHDSSAHILICFANMWIQKIQTTWSSGINIEVCSLMFLILTHLSLSAHAESEVWPRTCFPKVFPCKCTIALYHALSCILFSTVSKFKAMKQFHLKDGQVLDPESLLRLF